MRNTTIFTYDVMTVCEKCGIKFKTTHSHHISYIQNIKVELCPACHSRMRCSITDLYHQLDKRPIPEDMTMWYLWGQFIRFELENIKKPCLPILEPKKKYKLSIWKQK